MKKMFIVPNVKDLKAKATYADYETLLERLAGATVEKLGHYAESDVVYPPTYLEDDDDGVHKYLDYIAKSVRHMCRCGYVVFQKDWASNREARVLHYLATEYGLEMLEV